VAQAQGAAFHIFELPVRADLETPATAASAAANVLDGLPHSLIPDLDFSHYETGADDHFNNAGHAQAATHMAGVLRRLCPQP